MNSLLQDVRYAWRLLRANPGFASVAIITLALGIGSTSTIFSITHTLLIKPLPYRDANRLMLIWEFDRQRGTAPEGLSVPDYLDLRARQGVFEKTAAFAYLPRALTQRGSEAERVIVSSVTHDFFGVFGRRPNMGREFDAS